MKLKTILCTAGLLLAMITKGNAQTAAHDSIRVHIVQNINGVMTNIDTTVAFSQHAQLQAWLLSQGIEVPPSAPTPEGDSVRQVILKVETDDIKGDGSEQMLVKVMNDDSIPGKEEQMKIIMLPENPEAPLPPLPPAPPTAPGMKMKVIPPDVPGQENNHDMQIIIIKNDSTGTMQHSCTKTVIVNGPPKTPDVPKTPSNEKKIPESKDLTIYPNPSNGHITLNIDMPGKDKTDITVTDVNGKTVYSESLGETDGKVSKEIDLSKNGKGIYNVQVRKSGNVVAERVVIQ